MAHEELLFPLFFQRGCSLRNAEQSLRLSPHNQGAYNGGF